MPLKVALLSSEALTHASSGDEPSRLLTPDMMRKLHGTDIDAATAQRVLDDSSSLQTRAHQADAEAERFHITSSNAASTKDELANSEKDDASMISTVMAVAMAGRAITPSLDVLQQLVKAQRGNVNEEINAEQRQISHLKSGLDEEACQAHNMTAPPVDLFDALFSAHIV